MLWTSDVEGRQASFSRMALSVNGEEGSVRQAWALRPRVGSVDTHRSPLQTTPRPRDDWFGPNSASAADDSSQPTSCPDRIGRVVFREPRMRRCRIRIRHPPSAVHGATAGGAPAQIARGGDGGISINWVYSWASRIPDACRAVNGTRSTPHIHPASRTCASPFQHARSPRG